MEFYVKLGNSEKHNKPTDLIMGDKMPNPTKEAQNFLILANSNTTIKCLTSILRHSYQDEMLGYKRKRKPGQIN